MTAEEIREKAKDVERRLKEHDISRKLMEGELLLLHHVCSHANVKTWRSYDYKDGCDLHWLCEDCGLQKVP